MTRWQWLLAQLTKQLWVRATLIGALGVLAAGLAAVIDQYIPWNLPNLIGAKAVDSILSILASSMLAVTTFSLSIMVSAYASATNNVTPRAITLLLEDPLTQSALSTFVGSFLFGIVGLIVLKTGAYGDQGRVVLFAFSIIIIALVVIALLRWIDHLTRLGRVGETTKQVEVATCKAIMARIDAPYLGGRHRDIQEAIPHPAIPVVAQSIGYVQHIDMPALSKACKAHAVQFIVDALPGVFVFHHAPLGWIMPSPGTDDVESAICAARSAFLISDVRSFDQDPRFGLAVMSEIASRALSPSLNDAGTAIDVIGRQTRLLSTWGVGTEKYDVAQVQHPDVFVPPLRDADLFEDAFMPLSRDGAGIFEVQMRLHKSLRALRQVGSEQFRTAASELAALARGRAMIGLARFEEREKIAEISREK